MKTKAQQTKKTKHKPKRDKNDKNSIYYVTDSGCSGDCSKIEFKPFDSIRLLNIQPAPPQAQQAGVKLDAQVFFRSFVSDFFRTIRLLNAIGDPVGVVMGLLIDGFGGDEICKMYSENCECFPDKDNPFEVWTRNIIIPITVERGGVQYTANFEATMKFEIVNAHCAELV